MSAAERRDTLVEAYLRSVGIRSVQDRAMFLEGLGKTYGPIGERVAAAISAREEGEDVDVYALKNSTLALSIHVTSQYCSQMYGEFLCWLLSRRFPAPKSVLDVGCDNGVLTCFYAVVYPEAEVVGMDRCAQGIACARELAMRLDLANVRFEVGDLRNADAMFVRQSFDLLVSTTVFHEVLQVPADMPGRPMDAIAIGPEDSDSVRIVTGLARLLRAETGRWLSMERWPDAPSLAWWIRLLNQAGLHIIADQSTLLKMCNMDGEHEALPVVVATPNRLSRSGAGEPMLAFRMYADVAGDAGGCVTAADPYMTTTWPGDA